MILDTLTLGIPESGSSWAELGNSDRNSVHASSLRILHFTGFTSLGSIAIVAHFKRDCAY